MSGTVFDSYRDAAWPYKYHGRLHIHSIAGGIPSDEKTAESWIRAHLGDSREEQIQQLVAETMAERGVTAEAAIPEVAKLVGLNGFKRDDEKGLFIEGRQLKSALKEAVSVAVAAGKIAVAPANSTRKTKAYGTTAKGLISFFPEHVFVSVPDDRLYLGVHAPTGVVQRFVHTWRGDAISYEEFCEDVYVDFTVVADWKFTEAEWAAIWLTGELQGIGASRSQGFGTYSIVKWDAEEPPEPKRPKPGPKPGPPKSRPPA